MTGNGQKDELYAILGLNRDCSAHDIQRAYRRQAIHLHPDRAGEAKRPAFLRLTFAKDVLTDARLRRHYDLHGEKDLPNSPEEARWREYEAVAYDVFFRFLWFAAVPLHVVMKIAAACIAFGSLWFSFRMSVLLAPHSYMFPETDRVPIEGYYEHFIEGGQNEAFVAVTPFSFEYDALYGFVAKSTDPKTGIEFYVPSFQRNVRLPECELRHIRNQFDSAKYPL